MTIKECIDIVDSVKPNQYSTYDKVRWLSQLDMNIVNDIILTHHMRYEDPHFKEWWAEEKKKVLIIFHTDDEEKVTPEEALPVYFRGYDPEDTGRTLIADPPYDELYVAYLKMKIDEENGEVSRYNNSAALFNEHMLNFEKHYNKTHMPYHSQLRLW